MKKEISSALSICNPIHDATTNSSKVRSDTVFCRCGSHGRLFTLLALISSDKKLR